MSRSLPRLSRCIAPALLCLASAAHLCFPHVHASDVRGQLVLGSLREAPSKVKPPRAAYNWEIDNGVKELAPVRVGALRELAVVLVGAAGTAKPGENLEVAVSGGALLPSTIVLRTGSTLRIRNDDEIGHELFAPGLDGFSAEATSPGGARSVHLTKVGNWPLLDRLAAHARAHLHVLADLAATAKLESNGSFSFSDVAAGKYTLKVFRGGSELISKDIEVTDKPITLDPLTFGNEKSGS